jgi:hypothetical protein
VALLLLLLPSIRDGKPSGYSTALAQQSPGKVESVDRLQIEKKGGVAGFGGPHLKSRGELALSDLSAADRAALEALFNHPQKAGVADEHIYSITRQTPAGPQTIDNVPESAVPEALRKSVKDVIE